METKNSEKNSILTALLDLLKQEVSLHSVYLISVFKEKQTQKIYLSPKYPTPKKEYTYTLIIISHQPISKNLGDFMGELYHKMQKRCTVYPIVYTLSNVNKKMNMGDNFLTRILIQTPCIYKENSTLSIFSNFHESRDRITYEQIKKVWESRMNRANYLIHIVDVIDIKVEFTSKLATLHHALEQICMALLFLFWELRPQYYSLSYLMHLCGHITDLPQRIFPRSTYGLQRQFYMLCNAHDLMRFKSGNEFSERDADKAYNRCVLFYNEVKRLGETHLKHIKEFY